MDVSTAAANATAETVAESVAVLSVDGVSTTEAAGDQGGAGQAAAENDAAGGEDGEGEVVVGKEEKASEGEPDPAATGEGAESTATVGDAEAGQETEAEAKVEVEVEAAKAAPAPAHAAAADESGTDGDSVSESQKGGFVFIEQGVWGCSVAWSPLRRLLTAHMHANPHPDGPPLWFYAQPLWFCVRGPPSAVDAYLVFRALCKLSNKETGERAGVVSVTSHEGRSKVLALELLLGVLKNAGPCFQTHEVREE